MKKRAQTRQPRPVLQLGTRWSQEGRMWWEWGPILQSHRSPLHHKEHRSCDFYWEGQMLHRGWCNSWKAAKTSLVDVFLSATRRWGHTNSSHRRWKVNFLKLSISTGLHYCWFRWSVKYFNRVNLHFELFMPLVGMIQFGCFVAFALD